MEQCENFKVKRVEALSHPAIYGIIALGVGEKKGVHDERTEKEAISGASSPHH